MKRLKLQKFLEEMEKEPEVIYDPVAEKAFINYMRDWEGYEFVKEHDLYSLRRITSVPLLDRVGPIIHLDNDWEEVR